MRRNSIIVALVVGLALTGSAMAQALGSGGHRQDATPTASPTAAAAPMATARRVYHFRGRVTSANRAHRWFTMRTTTNRSIRIYTSRRTYWDGCDWDDMGRGHHVDVHAYRSHGSWVASRMRNWHGSWDRMWHMSWDWD